MTTNALRGGETNQQRINDAIRDLQQGRSNAHGSFTLTGNGAATNLVVTAETCAAGSQINVTPKTANAAALMTGLYIVAANKLFTVNHATTSNSDCIFTWSMNG